MDGVGSGGCGFGWDGGVIRTSRSSRTPSADPAEALRAAAQLARAEGWAVESSGCAPGLGSEARLVVTGAVSGRRCLLRVRERRSPEAVDAAAREAAASEHVVGVVRRIGERRIRGRDWEALLLAHPEGGDLSRRMTLGAGLRGGEAATVLLGVAAGLAALHRAGWARPGLSPSGVVFAGDGCPALSELDDVVPYDPEAAVADAEAFYGLARALCLRVTDGAGMTLLGAVETALRRGSWEQVEAAVLSAVSPEPVTLLERGPETVAAALANPPEVRGRLRARNSVVAAMEFLDGEPARIVGRRLGTWLRRRPAMVAVGAVPLIAAVAVVALLPAEPAESAGAKAAPTPRTTPVPSATADEAPEPSTAATPSTGATSGEARRASDGMEVADPVLAAAAVLEGRRTCFIARPPSADCLTAVLDAEPVFVAQESDALGRPGAAEERDFAGASLSLIERWGDAALIAAVPDTARTPKSEPASLLLVRNEAGWRLRAVYP